MPKCVLTFLADGSSVTLRRWTSLNPPPPPRARHLASMSWSEHNKAWLFDSSRRKGKKKKEWKRKWVGSKVGTAPGGDSASGKQAGRVVAGDDDPPRRKGPGSRRPPAIKLNNTQHGCSKQQREYYVRRKKKSTVRQRLFQPRSQEMSTYRTPSQNR